MEYYQVDAEEYNKFVNNLTNLSKIEIAREKLSFWITRYPKAQRADQYITAIENGETGEALRNARTKALNAARYSDVAIGYNTYQYINAALMENAAAWIY